jgi:hypothetical protein
MPVILSYLEAEIRRIVVPAQPQQKKFIKVPPFQWGKNLNMVVCFCHLSDDRKSKSRRIMV